MLRILSWRSTRTRLLVGVLIALFLESLLHQYYYYIPRPSQHLDPPFQTGCREPETDGPREKAAIIMLAQNSDLDGARKSMQSFEDHFNRWFHYPVIFMNDEPWSEEFKNAMTAIVSGEAKFEVLPLGMFGFPKHTDLEEAKKNMAFQEETKIHKGGLESYHHMCRFYSGQFYDVPALQPYKWYWRIEPNIEFSCAITYDPFREMAKHNKKYGYTVALWELDNTVPTLFRAVSDFKKMKKIKSSALWKSMIRPSWLPFPFRKMNGGKGLHDTTGDSWNLCHFWSNFEIASLEFFRSKEYRELFEYLDQKGGFYSERWGDASVHSLAAALMLPPEQLHHFADFGYSHYPWRVSPANAKGVQLPGSNVLGKVPGELGEEKESGIGCRCEWKETRNFQSWCFNRIQRPTHPEPWPNKIGW